MQPNIALLYDSRSPIGPLGLGWSFVGLGQITRCNKTVAQDTTAAAVALVTSDGYCINGNRLRLTSGTYGTAGSVYQTEIADFSQITAVGAAGNGPASFTVQARNGLTYYYGLTDSNGNGANSQVLATGTSTALTWLLSKVVDRAGNNYVINYTTLNGSLIGTAVPSKIFWTPTTSGGSSYAYTMEFNYTANVPQSSINKYVAGTNVSNPELLSSIEILSGSTVVKDYFLQYSASPTTGREQLTQVTECPTTTESSANCLSASTISYSGPSKGVSSTLNTALSSSGSIPNARYDFNGDGIPDLIYSNGTTWYVSLGSASGYGPPVSTGISSTANPLLGNLNSGLEDGILANNDGIWYYYTWDGAAFAGASTGLAFDTTASEFQLADINGDGRPDLIGVYTVYNSQTLIYAASIKYRLNTSSGTTVSFSTTLTTGYSLNSNDGLVSLRTADTQPGRLRRFDFNGDGNDDLVLVDEESAHAGNRGTFSVYELISNGSQFSPMTIEASALSPAGLAFVNWNDDACTDFLLLGTLYVSGCNGTVSQTYAISGTVVAAMDWDGDGRTDLVVNNGTDLGVYVSTAVGNPTLITTSIPYNPACQYLTMDATGAGLDDLGCWSSTSPNPISYYLHNGVPDLATSFTDGYGNYSSPAYTSLTVGSQSGVYIKGSGAVYPEQDFQGPIYVVDQVTSSDGTGGSYLQDLFYRQARINLQGRGFEGFGTQGVYDSRNATYHWSFYDLTFPLTGALSVDALYQSNDKTYIQDINNTWVSSTLGSTANEERYFPHVSTSSKGNWEVGGTENGVAITNATSTYTYDNYGMNRPDFPGDPIT